VAARLLASVCGPITLEKKVAKPPRFFGQGDIRGVAGARVGQ